MELFWVDLWLCIWSVQQNVRMRYTCVITGKTCYLELEFNLNDYMSYGFNYSSDS